MAELWMLMAVGMGKSLGLQAYSGFIDIDDLLDYVEEAALNGYGSGYNPDGFFNK